MSRPKSVPVRSTVIAGGRQKQCPHCDKGFSDHSNFRRHLRIHTNERPFHCHVCQAQFTTNQNLQRHIRFVHAAMLSETCTSTPSGTDEFLNESVRVVLPLKPPKPPKPPGEQTTFVCPHCEQELCSRPKLNRHLRYSCPFRDDVFASSSSSNEYSHSGDSDSDDNGDSERHTQTKRSRRIRLKRRAADILRHSPLLRPRREIDLGLPPLPIGGPCGSEALLAIARHQTKTPSRVVCPYGECLSTFRTRGQWMRHVVACHPREIAEGDPSQSDERKKKKRKMEEETSGWCDAREEG